jgi:hypothetical protein
MSKKIADEFWETLREQILTENSRRNDNRPTLMIIEDIAPSLTEQEELNQGVRKFLADLNLDLIRQKAEALEKKCRNCIFFEERCWDKDSDFGFFYCRQNGGRVSGEGCRKIKYKYYYER